MKAKSNCLPSANQGQTGASTLPFVVGAAVILALIQIPIFYKINSSNKFSGDQKVHISAKSLAESGIEQIIADLGQKILVVDTTTDTIPYQNQALGKGTYTTHLKADPMNSEFVDVVSEGNFRGREQIVNAKLEVIKTVSDIPFTTGKYSLWGIDVSTQNLRHYSLDERASGVSWVHNEGFVDLGVVSAVNVDDFTVAINGNLYFINNITNSTLYKIRTVDLDNDPSTVVPARLIGATGLTGGTDQQVRGMIFIQGVLYVITYRTKEVYELNLETGSASKFCDITNAPVNFETDAMTLGHDGSIYTTRTNTGNELWQFDVWDTLGCEVSKVTNLPGGANKVRAVAGHPDGMLYAVNGTAWLRINPSNGNVTTIFSNTVDLRGMGFHYEREHYLYNSTPLSHKSRVCHIPPGNHSNFHTIVVGNPAVPAHLAHGDYLGYCGAPAADSTSWVRDTVIQVRIVSWEERLGS